MVNRTAIVGFLVAPLVPAITLAALSPGLGVNPKDPASVLPLAGMLYVPAVALTAGIGIPTLLILSRLNLVRWWSAAFAGFAAGGCL